MNKEELLIELQKINIKLSDNQLHQLESFCMFLLSENKKYNLTAIRTYEEVLLKHVYDSLTLSTVIDLTKNLSLLDIGSGAGFPGIVLKIVFPNLRVTLLDSNGKKTAFLQKVKDLLALDNLDIITSRAEVFIREGREAYDLVTARAVANLAILTELAIPYLKINGSFISMKANIEDELVQGKLTAKVLKSEIIEIKELILTFEKSRRTLVVIKKQAKTGSEYPRSYERIIKKPLKNNVK
jgi:16S rRNA (guanine527-N7)-methyltransferase